MTEEAIESFFIVLAGIVLMAIVAFAAAEVGARKACKSINAEWVDDTCMKVTREKI